MRAGFSDNPEQWDVCRLTPCMLFVEMATIATASASSEVSSRPFLCRRRIESASWLSGIGLEIIDLLSTEKHQPLYDSFCLFGGPKCSFNDMVAFFGAAKEHQFIAGGFVFLMPKRIAADTRALTEDALIVVWKGQRKERR